MLLLLLFACAPDEEPVTVPTATLAEWGSSVSVTGATVVGLSDGDLDGDGLADLIVGEAGSGAVIVVPDAAGTSSLGASENLRVEGFDGHEPSWGFSARSDWNDDGVEDLLLAGYHEVDGVLGDVAWLLPGPLAPQPSLEDATATLALDYAPDDSFAIAEPWSVGDVSGDGVDDLLLCSWYLDQAELFLGPLEGWHAPDVDIGIDGGMFGWAKGVDRPDLDLDGDGYADLVVVSEDDLGAFVLPGPIAPGASLDDAMAVVLPDQPEICDYDGGDVDGDGVDDLVLGDVGENAAFTLLGPLEGTLVVGPHNHAWFGERGQDMGWSVALGPDRSGDGTPDLLIGSPDITYTRYADKASGPGGVLWLGTPLPCGAADALHLQGERSYLGAAVTWIGDDGLFALTNIPGDELWVVP